MAGIHGLNLNQFAKNNVEGVFELNNWTHWAVFNITDDPNTTVEVVNCETMGIVWDGDSPSTTWQQFTDALPPNQTRYALCNFDSIGKDKVTRSKIIAVLWCPDTAPVKQRLQTTMHFYDVKRQMECFGGIHMTIQANEYSDLEYQSVLKRIQKCSYCF